MPGKATRFRAPGGAPDPRTPDEPAEPVYRDRPIPVAASILWTPIDRGEPPGAQPTLPIFISQQVLIALHDHYVATGGACSGLLGGDLFRSPDSAALYLVVESTIRLPTVRGQDAKAALVQGWVAALDQLQHSGVQLVGWYRIVNSTALELSPAELEAHAALFRQPWQIVVTEALGTPPVGGVYRPVGESSSAATRLPFFELIEASTSSAAGRKQTRLTWTNYRSDVATFFPAVTKSTPAPSRPAPAPAPLVILPDQDDDAPPPVPAVGVGTLRRLAQRRAVRVATVATGGVVAAIGLLRAFLGSPVVAPPPPTIAPVASPTVASPRERLDRAGDTLALAIAAFELRYRLFSSRQMQCPELARGLVLVEERWAAYNAIRKNGGVVLDSARTARDRALYADADAVERRFESSGCPRP
ncbi:MAG TPA: hypothetical protein VM716_01750 [Gemmatimonadales bacterium]|nr:hypothetical protein [Gemmatimonadales bacterium]